MGITNARLTDMPPCGLAKNDQRAFRAAIETGGDGLTSHQNPEECTGGHIVGTEPAYGIAVVKISVLIPTCDRPDYLRHCLGSIGGQSLAPHEVLIGDDSREEGSEAVVARFQEDHAHIAVRYFRNHPRLGQSRNVDRLMRAATGTHLTLIHDDDWFLPDAFARLAEPFARPDVVVSFGRQKMARDDGTFDEIAGQLLNARYWRDPEHQGQQPDLLESALCAQFPNNGWLVCANAALRVGYADAHNTFGTGSDFRFSALFAAANPDGRAWLVPHETAVYRLSGQSIARSGLSTSTVFAMEHVLKHHDLVRRSPKVRTWLRKAAPVAIQKANQNNMPGKALRWYFSRWHRDRILTPGGAKRLAWIAIASTRVVLRKTSSFHAHAKRLEVASAGT